MKKGILLFISLLSVAQVVKAGPLMGGEIFYTYLGSDKYEVTVFVYRDCVGTPLGFWPISMTASAGRNNTGIVNTRNIPDGIYIVSIYTEKGVNPQRIIIRHR